MAGVFNVDGLPNDCQLFCVEFGFREQLVKKLVAFVSLWAFRKNLMQTWQAAERLLRILQQRLGGFWRRVEIVGWEI